MAIKRMANFKQLKNPFIYAIYLWVKRQAWNRKLEGPNFSFCNIMLKMITDAKRKGRSSFIMYVKEPLSV